MGEVNPFRSFVPPGAKYLLLGSFPGKTVKTDASYEWFYSSKTNQFWRILEQVYCRELKTRAAKEELFTQLGLAVADTIYECERGKGTSADTNLQVVTYNWQEIKDIFAQAHISSVFYTSRFVEAVFRRQIRPKLGEVRLVEVVLPSPSARFAQMRMEEKVNRYREVWPKLGAGEGDAT